MYERLRVVLSYRKARNVAVFVSAGYLLLYLYLLGDLSLTSGGTYFRTADDWSSLLFRQRISFNYESVAALGVGGVTFLISPMNIFLGGVLAILIGLNIGFLAFALEKPKVCGATSKGGVLASVPSLFLGFACCAPTILIALGSAAASVTLGFIALRSVFYPIAFIGLLASLWFNLRKMNLK